MEIWTFFTAIHSNFVSSIFACLIYGVSFVSLFGLRAKAGFLKNIAAIAPACLPRLAYLGHLPAYS